MNRWLVPGFAGLLALLLMARSPASVAAPAPTGPTRPNEFRDCADVCPTMVRLPAGTFRMGHEGPGGAPNEAPAHSVTLRAFAAGKFEVTHGEYAAFVAATGYQLTPGCLTDRDAAGWGFDPKASWADPDFPQGDRQPVVCVNWADASAYVTWLSARTGKTYRLLSEAEWEYAYRAGTTTEFFWGDKPEDMCAYANGGDLTMKVHFPEWPAVNCEDGFVDTAPVGWFKPNAFGLYDMAGNAWEWTADCAAPAYGVQPTDGTAYTGGACLRRVLRGGSWGWGVVDLRAAQRNITLPPTIKGGDTGFRVARDL